MKETKLDVEVESNEFLVATCDLQGSVTTCNAAYLRVSGYSQSELYAKNINIFRSQKVPKSIHNHVLSCLRTGVPTVYYAKGSDNGEGPKWMFVAIFPTPTGFMCIHMEPLGLMFPMVQKLYTKLFEAESTERELSATTIGQILLAHGFRDYHTLAKATLIQELMARKGAGVSSSLDRFTPTLYMLHEASSNKIGTITTALGKIDTLAINTAIAAARAGKGLSTLETIAAEIQKQSESVRKVVASFREDVSELQVILDQFEFLIAASALQVDVALTSQNDGGRRNSGMSEDLGRELSNLLLKTLTRSRESLRGLKSQLGRIKFDTESLGRFVGSLEMIQKTGTVESARVPGSSGAFLDFFLEMRRLIEQSKAQVREFNNSLREAHRKNDELRSGFAETASAYLRTRSGGSLMDLKTFFVNKV